MVDLPATTSTLQTLFADGQPAYSIVAAFVRRLISTLDVRAPYSVLAYGAKGDGVTDDSAAFQAAINACNAAGGGIVYVPPTGFFYVLKTGLFLTSGVCLQGAGSKNNDRPNAHTPSSLAQKGSWVNPQDLSNAAIWMVAQSGVQGSGAGARVEGLNFVYNQPAETGTTAWVATQYPYTIHMTDHYQTVENVQIVSASHGIRLDGSFVVGGTFGGHGCAITNVNMHVYNIGISIDTCDDCVQIHNINIENILGGISTYHYTINNLIGFDIHRCDNPWISDIQVFAASRAFKFTNGTDGSNRSMTNCTLNNIQANLCFCAFDVASSTTFVSANVSASLFQNSPLSFLTGGAWTAPTPGPLINLPSDNASMSFSGCTFYADSTILQLGNGGAGTMNILGFPACTFASSVFKANNAGGTSTWFGINTNAKLSTSAQYYFPSGGAKKGGSGVMVEATETTI